MYGPLSNDLANALMADRHRQMARVGRERSALRSRPSLPRVAKSGQSIAAMLGAVVASVRLALVGQRPSSSAY